MNENNFVLQISDLINKVNEAEIELKNNNFEKIELEIIKNSLISLEKEITESNLLTIVHKNRREAVSKLNNLLSADLTVEQTISISIDFICEYLNVNVGSIYYYDESSNNLKLASSYEISSSRLEQEFLLGDGTIGEVARSGKEKLLINPEQSKLLIITSYGIQVPRSVYTFPLIFQGKLAGVVELGNITEFSETSLELIRELNLVLSAFIISSIRNDKIKKLLEISQITNERLQLQKEELQQANVVMEEQQQQLEETNAQLEEQQQQLEEQQQQMVEISNRLKEKNRNLELSDKYKSEFVANMSHELRTPLNSIILLSDILIENNNKTLTEEDIKKVNIINSSGNELLRLINDILDLSKIESGKMEIFIENVKTSQIMDEIYLQFEHLAKSKSLIFRCKDKLKKELCTDYNKVLQVIKNLLSNAFKFTERGGVEVIIQKNLNNEFFEIVVSDTGTGIDEDKIDIIFDAFKQVDGTISRQFGGTGLGLSISKEICKLLNGQLEVSSIKDEGSVFKIILPISLEAKISNKETIEYKKEILTNEDRYLVVEENIAFGQLISDKLHSKNEEVIILNNGRDALEYLSKEIKFKGIILDLNLPDIEGIEILKEIKSNSFLKNIPLYVISKNDRIEIELNDKSITNSKIDRILDSLSKIEKLSVVAKNKKNIDFKNKKILVVDDDLRNIYMLTEILESRNAKVISASNGLEAIDKLAQNNDVDLILMDIMMPTMNGFEAISKIKASVRKNVPIIAITAKAMLSDKQKCIELGANDYISKPLNLEVFIKMVKGWL